ncbi:MAG: glycoside hydrolase family 9 protein [Ignavibacteria bacterium]|jgi:hypothetical protein
MIARLFFISTILINLIGANIYIRVNQVGYLPGDVKTGVILSDTPLSTREFIVKNSRDKSVVHKGVISQTSTPFGNFRYVYKIDFTELDKDGNYFVEIESTKSPVFKIGKNVYNGIASKLLKFFEVQRCGYTNPYLHEVCHRFDATSIIENGEEINRHVDVTGGWHDSGDYVKFLNTTAYAAYMLMFAYEYDPVKFGFDNNRNDVPDVLEEAKVGLDWLLRCNYEKHKLITQVQDLRDHDVGWRLPEDDPLENQRPAYTGIGKNLIGIYVAALSLASRIWKEKFQLVEFSEKCLKTAQEFFSIHKKVKGLDSSTVMFVDQKFYGKLALGAVELYNTTNDYELLLLAKEYADSAKSDYWWSWGDINSLAHYKLSKHDAKYVVYIQSNLNHFNEYYKQRVFGEGAAYSWGTNNTLLGISLQNILYKELTHDNYFDTLDVFQRDFILGKNQWGLSFISQVGDNYVKNFHHQVSYLKSIDLPGGLSGGPVTKEFLSNYDIPFEKFDYLSKFQTDSSYFRDDRNDYISNEPSITANATGIFVFGFYGNGR